MNKIINLLFAFFCAGLSALQCSLMVTLFVCFAFCPLTLVTLLIGGLAHWTFPEWLNSDNAHYVLYFYVPLCLVSFMNTFICLIRGKTNAFNNMCLTQ